jgi:nucleotide-binding universal stress UspA family protein
MIRSILVPLDGTSFGEHALPMALTIAHRAGATIHLAHVHEIPPPATLAGVEIMYHLDERDREADKEYLNRLAGRIAESWPVTLKKNVLVGNTVSALKEFSQTHDIDLVVMSTHGRGAFARFWLGSVADELSREVTQPVLLIRPKEGEPDLKREVNLKLVLLPSDGTVRSEEVFGPALELAKLFNSHLDVMRVVKPVMRPSYMPDGATVSTLPEGVLEEIRKAQAKKEARAQVYLDDVSDGLAEDGYVVETHVVVNERPADGIEAEARVRHADLIAMETHARSGLGRLFLGSVAGKVVRDGTAPVLLHHASR